MIDIREKEAHCCFQKRGDGRRAGRRRDIGNSLTIIRTYRCGKTLGVVYVLYGNRCSRLIGGAEDHTIEERLAAALGLGNRGRIWGLTFVRPPVKAGLPLTMPASLAGKMFFGRAS